MFVVWCPLFVDCRLFLSCVIRCVLVFVCCFLVVAGVSCVVCVMLFVCCRALFVIGWLLLFVVRSLLFVACCSV